jgi:hypothetical protein
VQAVKGAAEDPQMAAKVLGAGRLFKNLKVPPSTLHRFKSSRGGSVDRE